MFTYHAAKYIVHYGMHFFLPGLFTLTFAPQRRGRAYLLMLLTMVIDLDHLLATPVYDPGRMSIGFHPLHSYPAILFYVVILILSLLPRLPYSTRGLPWQFRAVGVGLVLHVVTDWQDGTFWGI